MEVVRAEITALPELVPCLAISGCIVTVDAMGRQREIARQILDQGAAYVLALGGNQGTLPKDVEDSFRQARADQSSDPVHDFTEIAGKGRGRGVAQEESPLELDSSVRNK